MAVVLIGATLYALRASPVGVETAAVVRGTLRVTVDEDGHSRVTDRYLISAPLAGTVIRPTLRAGDSVRQGDVVVRLVPIATPLLDPRARTEAEARLAAAQAAESQAAVAVTTARSAAEFARREGARQRVLFEAGATSSVGVEQAELAAATRAEELASAEYGERIASSEVRVARAALERLGNGSTRPDQFPVRAPVRGTVLRVVQESEGVVQAGTPLLEIGDPASLEAVVDVLTTDAVGIKPGAPVRIERWGGDSALRAHVRRVEPSAFTKLSALGVEEQRVNVVIAFDDAAPGRIPLGDGFRVEASILVWQGENRLLVPAGAVFRHDAGWSAYVLENGKARLATIEIGRRNGTEVEVLGGLREGQQVVLYPTDNVVDGARVREM
jgi:HlyD family secretion protein